MELFGAFIVVLCVQNGIFRVFFCSEREEFLCNFGDAVKATRRGEHFSAKCSFCCILVGIVGFLCGCCGVGMGGFAWCGRALLCHCSQQETPQKTLPDNSHLFPS